MPQYNSIINRITGSGIALGLAAETEKIFLHGAIRDQLEAPASWPLVYSSMFPVGAAIGAAAGYAAVKGAKYMQGPDTPPAISNRSTKALAVLSGLAIAALPIKIGVDFEMYNKCERMSIEQRQVNECEPDPIDASVLVLGGALGIAYANRQRHDTAAAPTAFASGTDRYNSPAP
jgi:hypothetical protein